MITTEIVDWTDPRVATLHTALFAEMGALYKEWLDALSPVALAAAQASLVVDPDEVVLTLLMLDDGTPIATGAVRRALTDDSEWDVKRVYVVDDLRGQGLSKQLMIDLETRAAALGGDTIALETGGLQAPAHGLYESLGYERCDAFPPYGYFPGERFYRKTFAR